MRIKILMIAILLLGIVGCSSMQSSTEGENNLVQLRLGPGFFLYPGPGPESLGELEEISGGIRVNIIEEQDEWAHISYPEGEGWIPKWYISPEESDPVKDISSEPKVLNQNFAGRLYPDGPKIVDLEKGKLLNLIKECNNWYEVEITVYDIPAVQLAWVPENVLSSVSELHPIEGYLRQGTQVYEVFEFEKIPMTNQNSITYEMNVFIISERDEYLLVGANGGWSAWTKRQNLVFAK